MQIHELNDFTNDINTGAFLAVDDGTDTGKVTANSLLKPLNDRIDNIITNPAPTEEEIIDARLGANDVVYPSLGDAIRGQFEEAEENLTEATGFSSMQTIYNDSTPTGNAISSTNRLFLNGTVDGKPQKVNLRTMSTGSIKIEVWEVNNAETALSLIKTVSINGVSSGWVSADLSDLASGKYMVSVVASTNTVLCIIDVNAPFNAYRTTDLTSTSLLISALQSFSGLNVTGYVDYVNQGIIETVENLESAFSQITNSTVIDTEYNTGAATGAAISTTNRWFLNGFAYGLIKSVSVRCRLTGGSIKIEGWELSNGTLTRVFLKDVQSYAAYDMNVFNIGYRAKNPIMVSVVGDTNLISQITDTTKDFNAYRTTDLESTSLSFSGLQTFTGLNVTGFITYETISFDSVGNCLTVSGDGSAEYINIADAVAAAVDGDTILVYPGTYTEPVEAWGKTIDIIGVDKNTCIILNTTGNYSTPAVEMDSGRIANFTIISDASDPTTDASDTSNYMLDYSIHADNAHAQGRTLIIEGCIIRNNHRAALGIGGYKDNTVIVRDCDIWSGKPPADIANPLYNKRGVLYFHNRQPSAYFSNVTGQLMRFINNTMYCEDIIAVYVGDTTVNVDMEGNDWINEMSVEFINNMICAKDANGNYKISSDGIATPPSFTNDSIIGGTGFTTNLKLSSISYGNNVSMLNA